MKISEIRSRFTKYFESKGHKYMPSSSLIPDNDPTLLFINAGMAQFKDSFTGKSNPADTRVTTVQKCVRAGGKHNDLENVGFTARHHTFFEMLGNFSFGDYFKKEAIAMAWEFLTKDLGIDKEKLYVTVHDTDQEAADIWHEQEGVPRERIFFRDDKDNFWEMGEVGPCGPSSEIFYDHGEAHTDKTADTSKCLLDDEERYVEIWNLVFMQYERYKESGKIKQRELPKPCVDTGAGLERIAAVMQGLYNNFDTDAFKIIIEKIEQVSGKKYQDHAAWMRVVADHARASTLLLADGVIPSNEGRGYVLRRIIRRAIRHLDLLGVSDVTFYQLSSLVFKSFHGQYAENEKNLEFVEKYLKLEEENFRRTLSSGLKLLEKAIKDLNKQQSKVLSGKEAFTLYDSHGFPLDLTEMILKERGLGIDEAGFTREMQAQKERSKKGGDFSAREDNSKEFYQIKEKNGDTEFLGYNKLETAAKFLGSVDLGDKAALIFDKTAFYAEGGGQAGDIGVILDNGNIVAKVIDTVKPIETLFAHIVSEKPNLKEGSTYSLSVDSKARKYTMSNHTATHLLQAALIQVLGAHIKQAGSSVGPSRLRFDYTHPEALTKSQLKEVERLVNEQIAKQVAVTPKNMTKDEAMKLGAMALFGEKYGNDVRVIDIPNFSIELCGGTHVANTSEIGQFKIISESSLAAGVRRVEAVTNSGALEYVESKLELLEKIELFLNAKGDLLFEKLNQLQENLSNKNKQVKELKEKIQALNAKDMFDDVKKLDGDQVFKYIEASASDDIRKIGDLFINKFPKGIALITSLKGDKASVLLKTFKGNKTYNCSNILKDSMSLFGGRGGGKPDMAQGSVDSSKVKELVETISNKFS